MLKIWLGIGAGVFAGILGLGAILDAIQLFNEGRRLRAGSLLAFGLGLALGGFGLVSVMVSRIP